MNKLNKLFVVILSSLFISAQAFAGELAVTGSAKASYAINGGDSSGKGLGISNELKFAADGELDNGFTWSYFMELDGNDGGAHDNDDSQIAFGMGDLGTLKLNDSEGGLSTETGYGIGAMGVGDDYANTDTMVGNDEDISGSGNIEYNTASGLLPFGLAAKVAYVPNNGDTDNNSYKNGGGENTQGITGDTNTMYQVTAAPIDGLNIGASYKDANGESGVVAQSYESGGYYANYSMGNFKVGVGENFYAPAVGDKVSAGAYSYKATQAGIEMAINDALSISYSEEKSTALKYGAAQDAAAGKSPFARTDVTFESTFLQAAYDIGGATVGISNVESKNSGYVEADDQSLTIISLALAF